MKATEDKKHSLPLTQQSLLKVTMLNDGAPHLPPSQLSPRDDAWHSDKILRHALLSLNYKDPEDKTKGDHPEVHFSLPPVSQLPRPGAAKLDPPPPTVLDAMQTVTLAVIGVDKPTRTKPEPKENSSPLAEYLKVTPDELKLCLNDKEIGIDEEVKTDLLPFETKEVPEEEVVVVEEVTTDGELSHAEILSRLSSARILPAISSSQVCSVLSALDVAESLPTTSVSPPPTPTPTPTPTLTSTHTPTPSPTPTPTHSLPPLTPINTSNICRKRKLTTNHIFLCDLCPYLTLGKDNLDKHLKAHSKQSAIETAYAKIKCPGCPNEFLSLEAFQVHLAKDHLVLANEIEFLLDEAADELERLHSPPISAKIRVRNLKAESVNLGTALTTATSVSEPTTAEPTTMENHPSPAAPLLHHHQHQHQPEAASLTTLEQMKPLPVESEPVHQKPIETRTGGRSKASSRNQALKLENSSAQANNLSNGGSRSTENEVTYKYKCCIKGCAVRLKSLNNLNYHQSFHFDGDPSSFKCLDCTFQTNKWSNLTNHLWRYHMIDMELYACTQCDYKTNSFYKLVNIHQRIHGSERPFICDVCDKAFKNRKQMRNHKVIHTSKDRVNNNNNINNKNNNNNVNNNSNGTNGEVSASSSGSAAVGKCDVCTRTFSTLRMLRLHKDNVHGKLRPHLCNYCGYAASSKGSLIMHMRQHTGEKPFKCEECQYTTADHNSLRRHRMRHTGDKPYKCTYCTYACIQSSTYKAHLRSKHPGLELGLMFSCPWCSYRTIKEANYLAHMAKHDDKPAVDAAAAATTTSVLSNDIATVAVEDSLCAVAPVSIVPPVSPHSQEIEIDKLTQPSALPLTKVVKSPPMIETEVNNTLSRQPVIINIQPTTSTGTEASSLDPTSTGVNIELLYCDTITTTTRDGMTRRLLTTTGTDEEKYIVEIEPHVVHLVQELPAEYNTVNVMYPEFQSETITSDLNEEPTATNSEPLELKFKELVY